jgi:biotin transporter BioY
MNSFFSVSELARHLLEGAENFDTRVWVVAVAVVMGTLVVLSIGTCYLLCKEYNMPACKYIKYQPFFLVISYNV